MAVGSDFVCGNPIALQLVVTYDGGISPSTTLNFSVGTGVPNGAAVSVAPALAIPDNTPAGVTSTLNIVGSGGTVTSNFNVDLNITHTWRGDLRVTLRSPAGTSVILHNLTGSSADNIVGNYPLTLTPAQSLATLIGQPLDGIWSLIISDNAGDDTGILNSWGINDVTGYECDTFVSAVDDGALPSRFAVSQNRPNPFNPSTTISFAVPENAGQVTLAIFDVSGRLVRTLESGSLGAGTYTREWNGRDDMGRAVGSGTYFYRLAGNEFSESRKMILIQ